MNPSKFLSSVGFVDTPKPNLTITIYSHIMQFSYIEINIHILGV